MYLGPASRAAATLVWGRQQQQLFRCLWRTQQGSRWASLTCQRGHCTTVWLAAAPARQVCVWTGVDALRVWARGAIDLCIQSLGFICSTSISSHLLAHVAYVRLQCSCWKTSAQHEAASSCLTGQQTCFIGAPGALQCCQLIICPHLCCACACLLCTSA
jgi:hypothetical protein